MSDYRQRGAMAVRLARSLTIEHGDKALGFATGRRLAAIGCGEMARADLYSAVCAVLSNRESVFTRWQARVPGRSRPQLTR